MGRRGEDRLDRVALLAEVRVKAGAVARIVDDEELVDGVDTTAGAPQALGRGWGKEGVEVPAATAAQAPVVLGVPVPDPPLLIEVVN